MATEASVERAEERGAAAATPLGTIIFAVAVLLMLANVLY